MHPPMHAWHPLVVHLPLIAFLAAVGLDALDAWSAVPRFRAAATLSWWAALAGAGLAIATGLYIGAHFGPGPRDGLMTGLAARGWSVRLARTVIEVVVVITGFLLGGTVGVGTLVFALAIGPLAHVFLPLLSMRERVEHTVPDPSAS